MARSMMGVGHDHWAYTCGAARVAGAVEAGWAARQRCALQAAKAAEKRSERWQQRRGQRKDGGQAR